MKEELLHFVWKTKRFDFRHLTSTTGQPISILQFGHLNPNAGPDFLEGRIKIGKMEWAGHIEMHLKSSDWYKHGHQEDRKYDNVILHVVWEEDVPVFSKVQQRIPCLELKGRIPKQLILHYRQLIASRHRIPCEGLFATIPDSIKFMSLESLAVERLQVKSSTIAQLPEMVDGDIASAFYKHLASSFGLKVNTLPFELLAASLPLSIIGKHRGSALQCSALFHGQAGFLARTFKEDYPSQLKREYSFLKSKYDLTPIDIKHWKFLRMRPAGFPTLRVAMLATLYHTRDRLFSQIMYAKSVREVRELFMLELPIYWNNHYLFDKPSSPKSKSLGDQTFRQILLNSIIPFMFYYGKWKGASSYCEKALDWMASMPVENNKITRMWKDLGLKSENGLQGQALIHLKKSYCDKKRCADCKMGGYLLTNNHS